MWHCGKCHCVLFLQTRAHSHVKEVLSWSARAKAGWGPRKSRGPNSQAAKLWESVVVCLFVCMYVQHTCTENTRRMWALGQEWAQHKTVFEKLQIQNHDNNFLHPYPKFQVNSEALDQLWDPQIIQPMKTFSIPECLGSDITVIAILVYWTKKWPCFE